MVAVPIFVAVFIGGLSFILDPLTLNIGIGDDFQPMRLLIGVVLLAFALIALLALFFQKRWTLLSILLVLFAVSFIGVVTRWGGLVPEREVLPASTVLEFMESRREIALQCVLAGYNLQYPTQQYNPNPGSMCASAPTGSWYYPLHDDQENFTQDGFPKGWRLSTKGDSDTSDGTFVFSAISVRGEVIYCDEKTCQLEVIK
ncbi:MAG: hypothetical protein QG636_376 [Patescibacteria group bacterium]|nr:hypothetical protein [Patescibacteria group bacterium]